MKISDYFGWIMLTAFFGYFGGRLLVAATFPVRAEAQFIPATTVETVPAIKAPKVVKKKKAVPTAKPFKVIKEKTLVPATKKKVKDYLGVASWYGAYFHGKLMACGKEFDMNNPRHAAHRNLPLGTNLEIINLANNKKLRVTILDRGPYTKDNKGKYVREVDLSRAAACQLGFINEGLANVKIKVLKTKNLRI